MDMILRKIIEGVANTRGEAFFQAIALQLNQVIAADFTFIARLDREAYTSKTQALVVDGVLTDNLEYSLAHTPCANAADDSYCIYPCGIQQLFPQDQLLVDLGVEGYVGTPLHDLHGGVLGIVVAMYRRPIENPELITTLFSIFSGRIEAEMERQDYEKQLQQLNSKLEEKVTRRTAELSKALTDLQQMQSQLVEAEKMAALGNLVAGIAHEVNSPLGVAVTTQGVIERQFHQLEQQLAANQLSRTQLEQFCSAMHQALPLMQHNLQRAADLIQNFKRTAADQHSSEQHQIDVLQYYRQILTTLSPLTRKAGIQIELDAEPGVLVTTIPGSHMQILSNLVMNSIQHGFARQQQVQALIRLQIRRQDSGFVVGYQDNGGGLSAESRKRLFEPFYTTARADGCTGLGMSILYNLVTAQLGGKVSLPPVTQGFALQYSFVDLKTSGHAQHQLQAE